MSSQDNKENTKSSSGTRPTRYPSLSAPREALGGSSISSKSVQLSESKATICPGRYSPSSKHPRCPSDTPSKSALKARLPPRPKETPLPEVNQHSPVDEKTPIQITQSALEVERIICELVTCVKKFKCPLELDFSESIENPLILVNNEKNKPFINQLRNLDGLRTRLAKIPTHDDAQLQSKHKIAGTAIGQTLQRMKEHQLKLRASNSTYHK
ncbi:hypothetical protein B0J17DRAFT_703853 [Rhizoctonia solani]|nr:hypothetical protein B0J17DRAFT_703853 [Rhizoctonia solani]